MKKQFLAAGILSLTLSAFMAFAAFAGAWQQDETGWWYENDDGSYPAGKWLEDEDGSCYYFNEKGYMVSNTTTPDGFQVNAEGVWVPDSDSKLAEAGMVKLDWSTLADAGDCYTVKGTLQHEKIFSQTDISNWIDHGGYTDENGVFYTLTRGKKDLYLKTDTHQFTVTKVDNRNYHVYQDNATDNIWTAADTPVNISLRLDKAAVITIPKYGDTESTAVSVPAFLEAMQAAPEQFRNFNFGNYKSADHKITELVIRYYP